MKIDRLPAASIECKRLNIPFKLTATCPECKQDVVQDFSGQDYLNYPKPGIMDHTLYCHLCDHEWTVKLELVIDLCEAKHNPDYDFPTTH